MSSATLRSLTAAALAVATGAAALAAPALAKDEPEEVFRLERRDAVGEVHRVETKQTSLGDVMIRAPGAAVIGGQELKEEHQIYTEEVLETRPDGTVVLRRHYELATRRKRKPKDDRAATENTVLHGREVKVTIAANGTHKMEMIGGGYIPDGDKNDAGEKIAHGLLPKEPVPVGARWEVDGAPIGKALFGPIYVESLFRARGRARFASLKRRRGDEQAQVKFEYKLASEETEAVPGIVMDLDGELRFSPALGRIVAFELEGPVRWSLARQVEGGRRHRITFDGKVSIAYKAETLDETD